VFAATLTNLAKQVQGLQTLAHAQVALTDVFLKYVITCVVEPRTMRCPRLAFAPGCAMKKLVRVAAEEISNKNRDTLKEWWPMNDEPLIRLRPRNPKHGPNESPRKYTGVMIGASMHLLTKFQIGVNEKLRS